MFSLLGHLALDVHGVPERKELGCGNDSNGEISCNGKRWMMGRIRASVGRSPGMSRPSLFLLCFSSRMPCVHTSYFHLLGNGHPAQELCRIPGRPELTKPRALRFRLSQSESGE